MIEDREILAYAAGLFDGEGCVNFTQAGQYKTWVIRAMIRNTDKGIIDWLRITFGGRVQTKAFYRNAPHWKTSYCWRLDWGSAIDFLTAIEPWVRIKKDQILVARLWDAIRNRKEDPVEINREYLEMIYLLVNQLRWLNRKGRRQTGDVEPMEACLKSVGIPLGQILAETGYASH